MPAIYLWIVFLPLLAAIFAGLVGPFIDRRWSHRVTIAAVGFSTLLSVQVFFDIVIGHGDTFEGTLYTWGQIGGLALEVGFLVDALTATMMLVVTFVSLMVHIYTIGYMDEDAGYQRFFSYISLFTFSMLMLVMSNNFLQLFFGWEAVGVVSYLLIGFWYTRPSAIYANLKAFLVNRVGDLGFLLGIAGVLYFTGTLNYMDVFETGPDLVGETINIWFDAEWSALAVICILLFVGAMGKSAQFPLHVWLPDSMEGPTPISALIHAATMVTAGIFMVARMSPLFELSEAALIVVMTIGAVTALFMGLLGLVQNDIKRVVAYSTLSQLGYMTVALGVSAYSAGIFHLFTHAFFKALLFLAAGSVIIAMHHNQDMRDMGGLRRYMPVTWLTSLIGTLALIGFPGFAGFFSKDAIIEAVKYSSLPGHYVVYVMLLLGVLVTSLYSFRLYFMVFHGEPRMDEHTREHLQESPRVVTWPLVLLAIPSVVAGWWFFEPMIAGDYFGDAIYVAAGHDGIAAVAHHLEELGSTFAFMLNGFLTLPFFFALAGFVLAWYLYIYRPELPGQLREKYSKIHYILEQKYGFDELYAWLFRDGALRLGETLWKRFDATLIDGILVNGSARVVGWASSLFRGIQTGYLHHYALVMIVGMLVLIYSFV